MGAYGDAVAAIKGTNFRHVALQAISLGMNKLCRGFWMHLEEWTVVQAHVSLTDLFEVWVSRNDRDIGFDNMEGADVLHRE